MPWTAVLTDTFNRANTSPGAAGNTTAVGNNWEDIAGGVYSIQSDALAITVSAFGAYTRPLIQEGVSALLDQQVTISIPAGTSFVPYTVFRYSAGTYYIVDYNTAPASQGRLTIWALTPGGGLGFIAQAFPVTFDSGHSYTLTASVQGSSPTTISWSFTDVTASNTVTGSATDSTAGLQVAGLMGIGGETANGTLTEAILYVGTTVPAQIPSLTATSTTISATATAPVGGQGSISYQWHASRTAGFTPGSGNALTGQTSLTLAHSPAGPSPGDVWYYVLSAVDSASTDLSSIQAAATIAHPAETIGIIGDSISAQATTAATLCSALAALVPGRTFQATNTQDGSGKQTGSNQAISGTTSIDWQPPSTANANLGYAVTTLKGLGVTKCILALGVNDSKDGPAYTATTVSAYKSNMATIAAYLVTNGITPFLCSPSCTTAGASSGAFTAASQGLEQQYGAELDQVCDGVTILRGDRFLWAYTAMNPAAFFDIDGVGGNGGDGIHPGPGGQASMQTLWADSVAAALGWLSPSNTLPGVSSVLAPASGGPSGYGQSANPMVGTVGLPTTGQVENGVTFGPGNDLTGTYSSGSGGTFPTAAQVLNGITFGPTDNLTGTVILPPADAVSGDTTYGPGGGTTGTAPAPADVAAAVWAWGNRTTTS